MNDSSENEGSQAIESEQNLDSTTQLESIQKDPNFANIQIEDIKAESPIQQDKEDSECSEDSEYSQEEIENQKHQSHRECLSCSDTPNQIVLLECGHALCLKCTLNVFFLFFTKHFVYFVFIKLIFFSSLFLIKKVFLIFFVVFFSQF